MYVKLTQKYFGKNPVLLTKLVNFDYVKMIGPACERDPAKGTTLDMADGSAFHAVENFDDVMRITEAKGRWLK
jgi:hypothetical protein